MDFLTRFGLERSRFTYLVMILVLIMGAGAYGNLAKRADPEITIRTAAVQATFDGMAPTRLEELIAVPIERKIREIGEVEDIETVITNGQALFYIHLYDRVSGSEIESAWEDLRNKMDDVVVELPDGTNGPFVNTDYGDVSIATIALTGDGFDLAYLEDVADEFRRILYQVPGITKVSFHGVQEERIWLELDTRKLASVGVQLNQLLSDLQAQNVILPAGKIDAGGTSVVLQANGDLQSVDEIRGVLTKVSGLAGYVRLSDLVDVRRGYVDPKETPAFFNGEPAIILSLEMASGTDIQILGAELLEVIESFERTQPLGISANISTFQETNVTEAVSGALSNVAQTFVVVFIAMLLFLGFRPAVVISCIVPFTIAFALTSMGLIGVDVEQVSIAAVIISLGLLVDNGLVVVEDIEGRINAGESPQEAAIDAGGQYVIPLAAASITTVSAFIPMLLMEGVEGEFAFSLGAVVSSMLLGSWLTALYVLPFLSVRLLRQKPAKTAGQKSGLIRAYGAFTRRLLPFGIPIIIATYLAVAFSGTQMSRLKSEMFPLTERADFLIYMDMPKEAAISETERQALEITDWLTDPDVNPGVKSVTAYIGDGGPRFYLSLNPSDPDPASAFLVVNTTDFEAAVETSTRARRVFIEQFPAARFRVTRLSNGGGEAGLVDVEISGPDADTLMAAGRKLEEAFADVPDIVKNEADWGNKVIKIVVDIAQDKAREFGVTSEDISSVMASYFSGTTYSTFREGDEQIPIVLRAASPFRDSAEDLANLSIAANGELISIDQVAEFHPTLEFSEIRRENQVRQIIVSAKSDSLAANQLLERVQPTIDGLDLGPGYKIHIGGELEDNADVNGQLGGNLPYAIGVMILALVFQFNSARRTLVTFMTIPIILIGAPYAMLITDRPMSFFAMLGLMSLMGIIINNAIVLINQIDLNLEHMEVGDASVNAAEQRARPIILTSLTTVGGLIPMAINGGALFEPMATIMIGGLLIASPMTLIFVPSVCYLFMRGEKRESHTRLEPSEEEGAQAV